MSTNLSNKKYTVTISLAAVPIAILYLCSALTGLLPQSLLNVVILAMLAVMMVQDTIYLAYPFMIFYGAIYGAIFGLSVYRIYMLMVLFSAILRVSKRPKLDTRILIPLVIYVAYAVLVIANYDVLGAVYFVLSTVGCLIICASYIAESKENIYNFFRVFVIVALIAAFTGMIGANPIAKEVFIEDTRNINASGTAEHISRFTATFEDPNYMGFFFTVAIFSTITLQLFKPWVRWSVVVALYVAILYSVSMTALVVNILLWFGYLMISGKMNIKAGIACVFAILVAVFLFRYGLNNPDTPIIGNISYRINEKILELQAGDMSKVTTGRTDLTKENLEYYKELPVWKQLFGGTPVNAGYIVKDLTAAAHNEYVDMLLNVGLVGWVGLMFFVLSGAVKYFKAYQETKEQEYICLLIYKSIWLLYAATLTVFVDFRFMMPFFI